eukprot:EG_transcript_8458
MTEVDNREPFVGDAEPAESEVTSKHDDGLQALEGEDRLRLFHLKAILVSGIGFFTDAYDLQVIACVKPMMAMAMWPGKVPAAYQGDLQQHGVGSLPTLVDLEVSAIALIGTLTGQLVFGTLGDKMGRKGSYTITLILLVGMTLLQVVGAWGNADVFLGLFLTWRFLLGVGIGGEYPLSAIISSEYASTKLRGPMVACVKATQGLGTLFAACMGMAVSAAYIPSITDNCTPALSCSYMDTIWRITIGIGAIPAALTIYLRMKLPESPRFTAQVDNDEELAAANTAIAMAGTGEKKKETKPHRPNDRITWATFKDFITRRRNYTILIGCAGAWFFQDMAYYSQSLFTPDILTNIGFNPSLTLKSTGADMAQKAYKTCVGNAIISLCGTVPGYYPVIFLINRMGRKTIQIMGFSVMVTVLMVMAAAYPQLLPSAHNAASVNGTPWAYMMLFCIMFFFANFGPNTTEFIIPGELFPTKFRSTCHGIASAWGKTGAVVGTFGFGWMVIGAKNNLSTQYPMDTQDHAMQLAVGLLSIMCFCGLLCTLLVPETTGLSLEEIVAK